MLHHGLLSDAYVAALFGANEPRPECEPHEGASGIPAPVRPAEPAAVAESEDEEDAPAAAEDDMETARTRPLRLDQIHL